MSSHARFIQPAINLPPNIVVYTTTRCGGVSTGNYAGLNVATHVGDDAELVAQNRQSLPYSNRIKWLNQVHSADVLVLPNNASQADASISSQVDCFSAVMTADCVPICIWAENGSQVAVVHAGRVGLLKNIIAQTVAKMTRNSVLHSWIGPAISRAHYEVDAVAVKGFEAYPNAIEPSVRAGHFLLDLPLIAQAQLHASGVKHVHLSGLCTYANEALFYSYRRACHNRLSETGRMVTVAGLIKPVLDQ